MRAAITTVSAINEKLRLSLKSTLALPFAERESQLVFKISLAHVAFQLISERANKWQYPFALITTS